MYNEFREWRLERRNKSSVREQRSEREELKLGKMPSRDQINDGRS